MIKPAIFKPYDIRGIYPTEINEDIFYKIARVCCKYFEATKVLVGCDGRLSSQSLKRAVVEGLKDEGLEIYDLNLVSTSTFNFLISQGKFDFGLQITASHNSKEYNGMKIYDKAGNVIGLGFGLEKIKEDVENFSENYKKNGKVINAESLKEEHKEFLLKHAIETTKKIAIDFSNGVGSIVFLDVLKEIDGNFILLNQEIDGNFPSHLPEPNEQTISELKKVVKEKNLDFGVAFDGDADRIVFVDSSGNIVRGDKILFILAKYIKPKIVVHEVSFPPTFKKLLNLMKIKTIETRVGRSFMVKVMRENKAELGGEVSSHFYFKETGFMEDAFFAFLTLLKIIEKENKNLEELSFEYKTGKSLSYKIEVEESKKYLIVEKLKEDFRKEFETIEIDGVKVIVSDYDWFLIRASNTEPILRVYIESDDENRLSQYKKTIDEKIKRAIDFFKEK